MQTMMDFQRRIWIKAILFCRQFLENMKRVHIRFVRANTNSQSLTVFPWMRSAIVILLSARNKGRFVFINPLLIALPSDPRKWVFLFIFFFGHLRIARWKIVWPSYKMTETNTGRDLGQLIDRRRRDKLSGYQA